MDQDQKRQFRAFAIALLTVAASATALLGQQTGELRVRVLDIAGAAVLEADVRVLGLGRVAHVEAGGEAQFENVPSGDYLIEAESTRAGRGVARATVITGQVARVDITVSLFFHGNEIVVSVGAEGTQSELYSPSSVIQGIDLRASAQASLGETLDGEPGVSSTYHGPGSSRPLIRGLGGDRVRILESGVGTGDASNTSTDHAPGVEAMMADRIEIIRGPATLLYGSSAIGGIVNVEDGRVPKELPAHPVTGMVTLRGGTVADERNTAGRLDGSLGHVAYHASALWRRTGDYSIPGFSLSGADAAAPGLVEGVLANSAVETARFAGGLSYVGDSGFLGLAYSGYDTEYGVPNAPPQASPGASAEEGDVGIDLKQRRVDFESSFRFGSSFLKGITARLGVADYQHFEVVSDDATGDREIETEFFNDEWEGRVELQHSLGETSNGALGAQVQNRDFEAIGAEAFVPKTSSNRWSIFAFEQFELVGVGLQAGVRLETQRTTNETAAVSRDDSGLSASFGAAIEAAENVSFVLNAARSVKLPAPEELFSDGPHLATNQFELGDVDLEKEVGYSLDAGLRISAGRVHAEVSFFVNAFDHFTYQAFTGDMQDGLRVAQWAQADAVFTGFEAQADFELFHYASGHFVLDASADYVRAELTGTDEPLPRIPPLRLGLGLGYESETWHGHAGINRTTSQGRIGAFETTTGGYTMIDASAGYRLFSGRALHDIVVSGTNLADQEARSHTSFLKNFAPLPGREVRLTYQISF